jgi:UDP-2,3-diacylglucosamine pyrophosphatase LpxH
VKRNVKNAVSFIGDFEKAIVRFSVTERVSGVVCGHIHSPTIRKIEGVDYYNCGDWVESCSALVENFEGHIELLTNLTAVYGPDNQRAKKPELPDSTQGDTMAV